MGETRNVARNALDAPIVTYLDDGEGGPVVGATVNCQVLDWDQTLYMDWDDFQFKASGHGTLAKPVPAAADVATTGRYEISGGVDLTATNLDVNTQTAHAEYRVTSPSGYPMDFDTWNIGPLVWVAEVPGASHLDTLISYKNKLDIAIAGGYRSVNHQGKEISFQSTEELIRAYRHVNTRIKVLQGGSVRQSSSRLARFKGFD